MGFLLGIGINLMKKGSLTNRVGIASRLGMIGLSSNEPGSVRRLKSEASSPEIAMAFVNNQNEVREGEGQGNGKKNAIEGQGPGNVTKVTDEGPPAYEEP